MKDEQLRASLRKYLEDALDQDCELQGKLGDCAHLLGPDNPCYGVLCAHIQQLVKRQTISSELLKSLESQDPSPAPTDVSIEVSESELSERMLYGESSSVSRVLGPFEREMVQTYNEYPEHWSRKYRPLSFGAANVDQMWRSGGEPRFTVKEGGIYHLIEDSGTCYVVPEPGLKLQEGYVRSEGLAHLFEVADFETGAHRIALLIAPAIVEQTGERWVVREKGELAQRTGN